MSAPWIVWGKKPKMSKKMRMPVLAVVGPVTSRRGTRLIGSLWGVVDGKRLREVWETGCGDGGGGRLTCFGAIEGCVGSFWFVVFFDDGWDSVGC